MFIAGHKKRFFVFLQERRGRSSPWVPSLRRHRDHHHERVPQVQIRRLSLSRLLRSHPQRIKLPSQIDFIGFQSISDFFSLKVFFFIILMIA